MVLFFSWLTVSILTVAIVMSYRFTMMEVQYTSTDYISQLIFQLNCNIDQYVGYMEDVSDVISHDYNVNRWLAEYSEMDEQARLNLEGNIRAQLATIQNVRTDIRNIAIFAGEDRAIFDSRYKQLNTYAKHEQSAWYAEALKNNGIASISSSHVQNIVLDEYRWVVSLSKAILDVNGAPHGVLLVDLNYSLINNLCKGIEMGKRGYIFVIDREGNIIFHPRQQEIYARLKAENAEPFVGQSIVTTVDTDQGKKLYISNHSEVTGWTVVGVAYQDEILSNRSNIIGFYITIGVLFLLLALLLSVAISSAITEPVKRLEGAMAEVRRGRLDVRSNIKASNEIGRLSEAFNLMITRISELINQREQAQEQRRQSELKALQAQINPHFLYNTLDSIIWMSESGNNDEVVEMTSALASLFRSSISEDRDTVPLSVEVANIQSYLTIQKMRYKEKLSYRIDIPRELNEYKVPKLILQPLVENAIYHGIRDRANGGEITVSAMLEEGSLVIRVADNGIGMTAGQLDGILLSRPSTKGSGIGVRNVSERIKLIFGEKYGLQYTSIQGQNTFATVTLPAKREADAL